MNEGSKVLSQREIDNLLQALAKGEVDEDALITTEERIAKLKKDQDYVMAYVYGWNNAIDKVIEMLKERR